MMHGMDVNYTHYTIYQRAVLFDRTSSLAPSAIESKRYELPRPVSLNVTPRLAIHHFVLLSSYSPNSPISLDTDPHIPFCDLPLFASKQVPTRRQNQLKLVRDTVYPTNRPRREVDVFREFANGRGGRWCRRVERRHVPF